MDVQIPAQGIMSRNPEHYRWQSFLVECDCTCPEHALNVHVAVDRAADDDFVSIEFYATLYTPFVHSKNWFQSFQTRVKRIWQLISKGTVEVEHTLIMRDQAALNFSAALKDAVEKHHKFLAEKAAAEAEVKAALARRGSTK